MVDNTTVLGNIAEQPERLRYVFENRKEFIDLFVETVKKNSIKKILFFGSGTSYNVSVLATYYFKHIAGIYAEAHYPTVFKNYESADWTGLLNKNEILFVGISQSGTSVSTCEVMKYGKENGYHTFAITGNLESEITKNVENKVQLLVGDELTPPETKGYTVSALSVFLWAVECGKLTGNITEEKYDELISDTKSLLSSFETVMFEAEQWYERNKTTIVNSDRIYVLGYGVDYPSVLEGMLKIGEMLRIPCIGYEIVEYSHGPTMALNNKQTIIIFGSDEQEYDEMLRFADAFRHYSQRVHIITYKNIDRDDRNLVFSIKTNKYLAPIMYTIPVQFVAAKGAKDIGIDTRIDPFEIPLSHYKKTEN